MRILIPYLHDIWSSIVGGYTKFMLLDTNDYYILSNKEVYDYEYTNVENTHIVPFHYYCGNDLSVRVYEDIIFAWKFNFLCFWIRGRAIIFRNLDPQHTMLLLSECKVYPVIDSNNYPALHCNIQFYNLVGTIYFGEDFHTYDILVESVEVSKSELLRMLV